MALDSVPAAAKTLGATVGTAPVEMHQIRYFLALARTLNFTRAAEECNVSQPSLTRAIRLLEHELGGELLRRERGLTHLTDLGARMLPLLAQCHESAASARSVAAAMKARKVAGLRVAMPDGVPAAPFAPHLAELLRAFDGLALRIVRGDAEATADALREGAADLAIAPPEAMAWDRFESWPLYHEPIVLAVPPGHRLARRGSIAMAEVSGERILMRRHCATAAAVEAAFSEGGVALDAAVELASDGDLADLRLAGAGVALAPATVAVAAGFAGVRLDGLALSREMRLYAVQGRQRGPAAAMLVTQLRAADWSRLAKAEA